MAAGDTVYAGSINQGGTLTVAVTAPDGASLVDEVQKLLDKATEARSRRLSIADRAAELYAPAVHLTAALAAIGWLVAGAGIHQAIIVATTVLIITCPCALALAIPAVQVAASGALFRKGMFLNAGDAIERLAEVDTVVFDKTGTLTLPEPGIANADEIPAPLLATAARLALSSRHPLAAALAARARGSRPSPTCRGARPGPQRRHRRRRGAARQPRFLRNRSARRRCGDIRPRLPPRRRDGRHPPRQRLRPGAVRRSPRCRRAA